MGGVALFKRVVVAGWHRSVPVVEAVTALFGFRSAAEAAAAGAAVEAQLIAVLAEDAVANLVVE